MLKEPNARDRVAFDGTLLNEWKNWLNFNTADVVDHEQIPKNANIITTRWVHTGKNALAGRSDRKLTLLAKSQCIMPGHKEVG